MLTPTCTLTLRREDHNSRTDGRGEVQEPVNRLRHILGGCSGLLRRGFGSRGGFDDHRLWGSSGVVDGRELGGGRGYCKGREVVLAGAWRLFVDCL